MELTEADIFRKCAKKCLHCTRNTVLPYEYEFTCTACGCNVAKRKKMNLQKYKEKN